MDHCSILYRVFQCVKKAIVPNYLRNCAECHLDTDLPFISAALYQSVQFIVDAHIALLVTV